MGFLYLELFLSLISTRAFGQAATGTSSGTAHGASGRVIPERRNRFSWLVLALALCLLVASRGLAQNTVSGEITGTVSDVSGGVIPNASVNITSADKGFNQTTTTGSSGTFRFALLQPGNYDLTVTIHNFQEAKVTAVVSVGQVTSVPVRLEIGPVTEIARVFIELPLLQTDNGNISTTVSEAEIELVPSGGQDLTNYALTSPGVAVSTGAGFHYGNFSANGLPALSNLFTINGNDNVDPYFGGLNNSGASNMLLGANEVREIAVVNNGYTGEYGRMAGANVNYTTKSGSNQFHGNAAWYWNGRYLNANDWFGNSTGTPRPFANSNQWAGSIGGPIKKDKLFFFYDNEGLRYVLPGGGATYLPTTAFENAVIAHLNAVSPGSTKFYNTIFNVYNGAPGGSRATPVTTAIDPALGCGDFKGTAAPGGGTFGTTVPCARTFQSTVNNLNLERLMTFRLDWNATEANIVSFRYKQDRGVQATGTDPINPAFNANSVQPEDDGQATWTRIINNHLTNQFIAAGMYYSAIFGPPNLSAALAVFPTTITFNDGVFTSLGGNTANNAGLNNFPQGRNVGQYQFVDDVSWTKGNHNIKFGVNFRRNNISSFAAGQGTSGLVTENSMTDFYNGVISSGGGGTFAQTFANAPEQPIAFYTLGLYLQDAWRLNSKLMVTLALRADRNSDPVCQRNCFARTAGSFTTADHTITNPYNSVIQTGLHQAFPSMEKVSWGPRAGFAWAPMNSLVVRGGVGIFTDLYEGLIVDRFITNLPNVTNFTVTAGAATIPVSPDMPGNVFTQAAASNTAFRSAFANGGTLASLKAAFPTFSAPNINTIIGNVTNPKYVEWNLEIEKSFGSKTSVSVNYVGNHGYDEYVRNLGLNTYCTVAKCPNGFDTLPSTAPDGRFAIVTELQQNGRSNYDGVTVSLARNLSYGFRARVNYTYSHALDDVSNGGIEPYDICAACSLRLAIDPLNVRRLNYSNSDYDFPHLFSATYSWELPFKAGNGFLDRVIGGWTVAGTFFAKSGQPFSVYNSSIASSTLTNGSSDRVLADFLGGLRNCSGPTSPCVTKSEFATTAAQHNFGNTPRNFFRGPGYFNSDFSIQKNFKATETLIFTLGANAFDVFNHPNFANPGQGTGSVTSGLLGVINQTATAPNSPYGNFQGATVSGRVLQLDLKVRF